jgi:hypothetical protein
MDTNMIIKIHISRNTKLTGDIGTVYIDTSDIRFIDEVKKYKCPIRMGLFLDNEIKTNPNVREIITDKEIEESHTDLFIDLTKKTDDILKNHLYVIWDFDLFIKNTSHLDKYGNVIENKVENDLTLSTDAEYEHNLDMQLVHTINLQSVANYFKTHYRKRESEIKKAFTRDELPIDTKFGDWDIELRNGYYHVSTEFLAEEFEEDENLELPSRNREELLFYAKELTYLNQIFYQDYNVRELSEIIAYKKAQLNDLQKQFQKRMENENKTNN